MSTGTVPVVAPRSRSAEPDRDVTASGSDERLRRTVWQWVVSLLIVIGALAQQPGLVAADTKLDLTTEPLHFLARAVSLWDPVAAAGQLQNQAYGYLFPMGPFFAAGLGVGLPAWLVQRLWWALVLLVAYHGVRRLCVVWGVGLPWAQTLAALTYALAPRLLGTLGAVSSEVWPMAVAPWVLLPLVRVRPGAERRAAARSATAVLLLGGINAVASAAALVVPALWLLSRQRGDGHRRLLVWWFALVAAASAWWVGPLLLLGRFSPPFLDWIESSAVTTAPASVTEALRGTTQWISGIGGASGPRWPAAFEVLTSPAAVALGLAVAVLGLAGVVHHRMPHRRFLLIALLSGLILVTLGHVGTWTAPWAPVLQDQLDGALAPMRNLHKFEPVVRLPLVLGLAHLLAVTRRVRVEGALWARHLAAVLTVSWLAASVSPAVYNGVSQAGAYEGVPAYWKQTASWLAAHPSDGRALVLPGAAFATSVWGDPRDEPLQPYATTPWLVRDGVPLGSGGLTRVLTAVEERVASGYGGPDLGNALSSLGVTRVILRNDLDWRGTGAPSPLVVRQALMSVPGARSVARLGPPVGGSPRLDLALDDGIDQPLPAVEILDLAGSSGIVRTVPTAGVPRITGGPEAALTAAEEVGQAFVLAAEPAAARALGAAPGPQWQTDTLQRREAVFSTVRSARGPVLAAQQPFASDRRRHDWLPTGIDEDGTSLFTVARADGGHASASTSAATPTAFRPRDLGAGPVAAFDGSGDTAWRSSGMNATGQWVQVTYDRAVSLPAHMTVMVDEKAGADVAAFTVTTDTGRQRTPVTSPEAGAAADPARYLVQVDVPPGATRSLRLEATEIRARPYAPVVLRDVGAGALPRVATTLVLPTAPDPTAAATGASFAATDDRRPACVIGPDGIARCSPASQNPGEQAAELRRVLRTGTPAAFRLEGTVLPAVSTALDRLLRVPGAMHATASSRWVDDVNVRPDAAVDGDARTYWAAAPDDRTPSLRLSWSRAREVSGLRLRTDPAVVGARPTRVAVHVAGIAVERTVPPSGIVSIPPTRARALEVTVLAATRVRSLRAGTLSPMPVVIGEVSVRGVPVGSRLADTARTGVPCGFGPVVDVDGRRVQTRVDGTVADLRLGRQLRWRACTDVQLPAGTHQVTATSSAEFVVDTLSLHGPGTAVPVAVTSAVPSRWTSTRRAVPLEATSTDRLLVVAENQNPGWTASLQGRRLTPVTLDGWSQAWLVPAGSSGSVDLVFTPQRTFRLALLAGAVLGLLVLLVAVVPTRSPRRPTASGRASADPAVELRGLALRRWAVGSVLTVGCVAAFGPVGLTVLGWALLGRVLDQLVGRRRAAAAGAALLTGLATVTVLLAAWSPWPSAAATNRQGVAQVLAVLLVTGAAAWTLRRPSEPPAGAPAGTGAPAAAPAARAPSS